MRPYWHDEPPRSIAQQLKLPLKTVKNRLQRGLDQLRKGLEPHKDHRSQALAVFAASSAQRWKSAFLFPVSLPALMKIKVVAVLGALSILAWVSLDEPRQPAKPSQDAQLALARDQQIEEPKEEELAAAAIQEERNPITSDELKEQPTELAFSHPRAKENPIHGWLALDLEDSVHRQEIQTVTLRTGLKGIFKAHATV